MSTSRWVAPSASCALAAVFRRSSWLPLRLAPQLRGAIERGEINPTFRVLLKLERGLQVPLSEITQCYERHEHERLREPVARSR